LLVQQKAIKSIKGTHKYTEQATLNTKFCNFNNKSMEEKIHCTIKYETVVSGSKAQNIKQVTRWCLMLQ